jgi:hypothetical protein
VAAIDAFKHLNSIDEREMAVSRQPGLVLYFVYAGIADVLANMTHSWSTSLRSSRSMQTGL